MIPQHNTHTSSPNTGSVFFRSPVLNTEDAASYVGLAKSTLEKLRVYGDGPVFSKYSTRAVRYRVEDLDVWIAKHRASNTSEGELIPA